MRHALRVAVENDVLDQAAAAYGGLSDQLFSLDRYDEALELLREALTLSRRIGSRRSELYVLSETSYVLSMLGRWEEALAASAELPEETIATTMSQLSGVLEIHLHQGRLDEAQAVMTRFGRRLEGTGEVQTQIVLAAARAALLCTDRRYADALAAGSEAVELGRLLSHGQQGAKQGFVWAIEAALALGDAARADELLREVEALPSGLRPPFSEAQAHRFRARMDGGEAGFKAAAGSFREYSFPFWLAVTELEHGEWLLGEGRDAEAEPLLAEAREIFERLGAVPWLERLDRAHAGGGGAGVTCASCGAENEPGRKFCGECGSAARAAVPCRAGVERADGEVLRRVRDGARRAAGSGGAGRTRRARTGRGAPPGVGAVRRPGRLHGRVRGP